MLEKSKIKITQKDFLGIKNPVWWFQEFPAVFGLCYGWMKAFTKISKYYDKNYQILVVPFKNDYGWQVLEKRKSIELARYVLSQYLKNSSFIWNRIKEWKKYKRKFFRICNQIKKEKVNGLSHKNLWKLYNRLMPAYTEGLVPALIIEAFEPYILEIFAKKIPYKDPEKLRKLFILEQPSVRSFMINERMDFLKICLESFKTGFYKKLEEHSNKFFWLRNNYKNVK